MVDLEELLVTYAELVRAYRERGVDTVRDPDDVENATRDAISDAQYLTIGENAVDLCVRSLVAHRRPPPSTVLDFACGSGRVTRHLVAMFPEARIVASDLYPEHLDFCVEHFGVEGLPSREDPDEIEVEPEFDLIFVGSLLTHLPAELFESTLRFVARALSPRGLALVTLEGRRSEFIHDTAWKLTGDREFRRVRRGFHRSGFGFADYRGPMRRLFARQDRYGVALVKPSRATAVVERMDDVALVGYEERAWNDHQDLLVIAKPGPYA